MNPFFSEGSRSTIPQNGALPSHSLFMGSRTGTRITSLQKRPTPHPLTNPDEYEILVTPLRDDISYDDAKNEIREYIEKTVEKTGDEDLSIGEIARLLRLDLNAVIDVFEERGLI